MILRFGSVSISTAVLGLLVLLALLVVRRRVDPSLERVAYGLLRWFPLFFVPSCVGAMQYASTLAKSWMAICVTLVVSTLLGLVVAAVVGAAIARRPRGPA
ncbi:MAG: CidA/LrgA family protein [Candidatus Eremiobacteraeota bacterium]|nr:CidA/LrgA family protein [Candidatus Eremiobacteraeota bacterium]